MYVCERIHLIFWEHSVVHRCTSMVQWTLTNPNSLGPELIPIYESFGLVNERISNGKWLHFYLLHLKIATNIINLGVQICVGSD